MTRRFVLFTTTLTEHLEKAIREDLIMKATSIASYSFNPLDLFDMGPRILASRERADCAFQLCVMYTEGRGGSANTKLAIKYLMQSIKLGDKRAELYYSSLSIAVGETRPTYASPFLITSRALPDPKTLLSVARGSRLANLATDLKPDAVALELGRMKESKLPELDTAHTMAYALSSLIRLSNTQMTIIGKTKWKQKFMEIMELLECTAVNQYFPNITSSIGGIDLLSFACRYNDVAVEWFANRYAPLELKTMFRKTFEETLPTVLNICMNCAHVERLRTILNFSKGNKLITTCYLFPDTVHAQPSLVSEYGEMFKAIGAGAALFETNPFGETAFDIALQYGHTDVMKYLLAQGESYDKYRLDPDFRIDQSRCSPLTLVLGYPKKVEFMMALTPKPRMLVTESGMNVFHVLASKESVLGK
jgi:hypothetical protein